MYDCSIQIKNYKCFKDETGFNEIQRVNLIIGRNNAGKSSLLDIIEALTKVSFEFDQSTWRDGQRPQIVFTSKIPEPVVSQTFQPNLSGGPINGNHAVYGQRYIGREIVWSKNGHGQNQAQLIRCDDSGITPALNNSGEYPQRLINNMPVPFQGKIFRRVLAERDIVPEPDNGSNIVIQPNGNGITNAFQSFINKSNLPSNLVEIYILSIE